MECSRAQVHHSSLVNIWIIWFSSLGGHCKQLAEPRSHDDTPFSVLNMNVNRYVVSVDEAEVQKGWARGGWLENDLPPFKINHRLVDP